MMETRGALARLAAFAHRRRQVGLGWVGGAQWWWTLEIDLSLVVGAGGRGGERTTGASAQRCVAFAGLPAAGCGCRLPDRLGALGLAWASSHASHR